MLSIIVQRDAKIAFYLFTARSLYMFRVPSHPSSGVRKNVTTASITGHIIGAGNEIAAPMI
jgi:hypothetical protein